MERQWFLRTRVIVVAILLVLAVGWALCSVYLSRISIGQANVPAHVSDAALSAALDKQVGAYRLAIGYPDGKIKKFPLSTVGLRLDTATSLRATRQQQHRPAVRLAWWRPLKATIVLYKNTAVFNSFIANQINITVQPSKDASLSIVNGDIVLTGSVTGERYGLPGPEQTLLDTAGSLRTGVIKLRGLKVNPALTSALLAPYKNELEKAVNQPASFKIGYQTIKPSPADIAGWLDITPDDASKKVDITVNSGKVDAYINSIAAAAIRPAKAEIDIKQADGSVRVLVPGVDGVDVVNKSDVATSVAQTLLNDTGFSFSLPVNEEPFQTITAGDYPKWIEVDLTNKRLYAYEHTNLVATYLVSAGAPATPTVVGQFAIYSKYVQQDMRGQNVDGSSYFQPNVPWVNYFYADYAIHGNYWRPLSYFGNINSSHGCVGLMDGDAEWIYDWAPIGTPVITHN